MSPLRRRMIEDMTVRNLSPVLLQKGHVVGLGGIGDEMHLESSNVIQLQFVGGSTEIAAELRNRADVGSLRHRAYLSQRMATAMLIFQDAPPAIGHRTRASARRMTSNFISRRA